MARPIHLELLTDFFNKIGPSRHFAAVQHFGRFRSDADMA
jgi:hypothetical protein